MLCLARLLLVMAEFYKWVYLGGEKIGNENVEQRNLGAPDQFNLVTQTKLN